jgi:hypothetical protein
MTTPSNEHVQTHQLRNGEREISVSIVTTPEGSKSSVSGLFGLDQPIPYSSIDEAREHWGHLVENDWIPI